MKKTLYLLLVMVMLLSAGCGSHLPKNFVVPTAAPDVKIVKPASVSQNDRSDADPWVVCSLGVTEEDLNVSLLDELADPEFKSRVMIRLGIQPDEAKNIIIVSRCMNGLPYVCNATMYSQCAEQVDLSQEPNEAMLEVCTDPGLDGVTLPSAVIGKNNAYEWICSEGAPKIVSQAIEPDSAGFNSNIWYEIPND